MNNLINKYAGECKKCRSWVGVGQGHLERDSNDYRLRLVHNNCPDLRPPYVEYKTPHDTSSWPGYGMTEMEFDPDIGDRG